MGGERTVVRSWTTSTHIRFVEILPGDGRVTKLWDVRRADGSAYLGEVRWYAPWRRYAFSPDPKTLFDGSCLWTIASFCTKQTEDRKKERAKERIDHGVRGKDYGA